ncbi:MAG: DUF6301 family protein [Propionibacteriaceae bacterium]|nr:DUF6301 family protein [Propionibacteriaceae bacterium]
MKSIPAEDVARIADFWVNRPWPLSEEEARGYCRELGWSQDGEGFFHVPYDLNPSYVSIVVGHAENGVATIDFSVTDYVKEESDERSFFINDVLAEVTAKLSELWGKPKVEKRKTSQQAQWDLENRCRVRLTSGGASVIFVVLSPSYADTERYLEKR